MIEYMETESPKHLIIFRSVEGLTYHVGFMVYDPKLGFRFESHGKTASFDSSELREMADKLDELNKGEVK